MKRVIWSPRSIRDLESIREYIARDSLLYADLVVQRLIKSVDRLVQAPESGRIVPELAEPSIREVIIRPHRLVYRIRPQSVEVVTVFHAARLFPGEAT